MDVEGAAAANELYFAELMDRAKTQKEMQRHFEQYKLQKALIEEWRAVTEAHRLLDSVVARVKGPAK